MFKSVSIVMTIAALLVSLLCGVLFVFSLAAGRLWLTAVLAVVAAATAWIAFRVPPDASRR